jgi:hypothetical protein
MAGWMATKGTAWVLRRSTDLVPSLLMMAAREVVRGRDWEAPAETAGGPPEQFPERAPAAPG